MALFENLSSPQAMEGFAMLAGRDPSQVRLQMAELQRQQEFDAMQKQQREALGSLQQLTSDAQSPAEVFAKMVQSGIDPQIAKHFADLKKYDLEQQQLAQSNAQFNQVFSGDSGDIPQQGQQMPQDPMQMNEGDLGGMSAPGQVMPQAQPQQQSMQPTQGSNLQGLLSRQAQLTNALAIPGINDSQRAAINAKLSQINNEIGFLRQQEEKATDRGYQTLKDVENKDIEAKKTEFSQANTLRDEYQLQTKPQREVIDKYRQATSLVKEGTVSADNALINVFARALSPGIVTNNDFEQAVKAGGLPEQAKAYWDKLKGQGTLTPEQRQEVLGALKGMASGEAQVFSKVQSDYAERAKRAGVKVEDVIPKYGYADTIKELTQSSTTLSPELQKAGFTQSDIDEYKKLKGLK